jgi:uncharacterized protein YndB with AHSA1/START domain
MTEKKTIELVKTFAAPVAVLFDAIKDGQLLRSTNVQPSTFKHDFRVGGDFYLEWTCKTGGLCTGRYLQIVPNEKVQFTWNSKGCDSSPSSETTVTVMLKGVGKSCQMRLTHEGLDAGLCYEDHLAGWTSSLEDFATMISQMPSVN